MALKLLCPAWHCTLRALLSRLYHCVEKDILKRYSVEGFWTKRSFRFSGNMKVMEKLYIYDYKIERKDSVRCLCYPRCSQAGSEVLELLEKVD